MNRKQNSDCSKKSVAMAIGLLSCVLVVGGLLLDAQPAAGGLCAQNRWWAAGHNQDLQCTAGEVQTLSVVATDIADGCDFAGDTATVALAITFHVNPQGGRDAGRFDFGIFAALDGGDALTGACYSDVAPTSVPFVNSDGDTCGDVPGEGVYTLILPTPITLPCIDDDDDGIGELSFCWSWRTGGAENLVCNHPDDVFPGNPSKCDCVTVSVLSISVPYKTIRVLKEINPTVSPDTFSLLIDGVVEVHSAGNGGTTNYVPVSVGTHSVSETNADGTPVSSSLWQSDISCEDMAGRCLGNPTKHCIVDAACPDGQICNLTPTPVASCTSCTTLNNVIVPDQLSSIQCTIINTRRDL